MNGLFRYLLPALVLAQTLAHGDERQYAITTKQIGDRIEVHTVDHGVAFHVHSAKGIGSAKITKQSRQWPEQVILRWQLNGLESFQLATNSMKLSGSVTSGTYQVRLWRDSNEQDLLKKDDPAWIEIKRIDQKEQLAGQVQPTGYFEMLLPKALFVGNPDSLTFSWIDFYR